MTHGPHHHLYCACWQQRECHCYLWDQDCPDYRECSTCEGHGYITYELEPGTSLISEICWKCSGTGSI